MYTGYVIIALLVGLITMLIAKEKGLDPVKWFLIGFFGSVVSLTIIIFIKKKIDEKKAGKKPS